MSSSKPEFKDMMTAKQEQSNVCGVGKRAQSTYRELRDGGQAMSHITSSYMSTCSSSIPARFPHELSQRFLLCGHEGSC